MLTEAREFLVRRLAHQRMIFAGRRAQACTAARLAAKLYKAGASVDSAARRAALQVSGGAQVDPYGGAT